jgi:AbrB family looped-hinge helix DNA binding protein
MEDVMAANLSAPERQKMKDIVAGLDTKAARIRALDSAGYSRSQIAAFLEIRYQHVRNVLVRDAATKPPKEVSVAIGPGGRIVIPAPYRQALGLSEGDQVMLSLGDAEVRVASRKAKIRAAQDLIAKYVPQDVDLVDELIAERRREASRDSGANDG